MRNIKDCYEMDKSKYPFLQEYSFSIDSEIINLNAKKKEMTFVRERERFWVISRRGYQAIKRKKHEKN